MGMIKRADVEQYTRNAYVMDLDDLEKRGKALIDAANTQASQIIKDAGQERVNLISNASTKAREQGYEEGHSEGHEKGKTLGLAQAHEEHHKRLEQIETMWSEQLIGFEQKRDAMLESARVQVIELAAAIAQRVVRRMVQLDPGVVLKELESVLSTVTEPTRLVISVNPEDAELAQRELPGMIDRFASCEHAQVITDPSLPRGSCVARTPGGGLVDASLTKQLDRIVESLLPDGHIPEGALQLPNVGETDPKQSEEDTDDQEDAA